PIFLLVSIDSLVADQKPAMGSLLGVLPSFDPLNFNQLRPSDPSNPCKLMPVTYHSSHIRTPPPPDQVITTETKFTY
ncbi:hypothetical protein V6Z12_A12G264700, partial [Gossypium hirsutum]